MSDDPNNSAGPDPLRVAWVTGSDTLARFGRTLNPLAVGLMDEFVELTLLAPHEIDVSDVPSPPGEIIRYARPRWPLAKRGEAAIARQIQSRKIQLLHALDWSVAGLVGHIAREAEIDYIVSILGLSDARRIGRLGHRSAGVLAACEAIEQRLIKHHVAPAEKVHLLPPGLHMVKHPTCFADPKHTVAIVASCRMTDWAPLSTAAATFAELKRCGYDCVYTIVGAGPLERRIRRHVIKLAMQHEVIFAEPQTSSQLAEIIKAADVYISLNPGKDIDFGSLLAMAGGVPVLAGRDQEDFIIDGRTAAVFNPASSGELVEKLAALMDNRAAARDLAEGALEYLRRHHSPSDMVAAAARIYRQSVSGAH